MTIRLRIGSLLLALLAGGLLAGCAGYPSSVRRMPVREFEIVETSTKRQLTDAEMAYLRAKVAEYLAQAGQTGSGDYYVKIFLGEEAGVQKGDWVVVRFTRYPSALYASVSEPGYSYDYPAYGYSSWDYFPFGWMGFGAFSLGYFDDPYHYGYYTPGYFRPGYTLPRPWPGHRYPGWDPHRRHIGDGHHGRDRNRDDHEHRPRDHSRPSGALKPSFVPANVGRTRWNGSNPGSESHRWQQRGSLPGAENVFPRPRDRRGVGGADRTRGPNFGPEVPRVTPAVSRPMTGNNYQPITRSNLHRRSGAPENVRPSDSITSRTQTSPTPRVRSETGSRVSGERREYQRPSPVRQESSDNSYSAPAGRTSPGTERPWQGAGRGRFGGREP